VRPIPEPRYRSPASRTGVSPPSSSLANGVLIPKRGRAQSEADGAVEMRHRH
jgi:hypothetical protein